MEYRMKKKKVIAQYDKNAILEVKKKKKVH